MLGVCTKRRLPPMSLRLRLIVAFFFLSVVPLAAVTFYSYASNVRALQVAAQHETEMLTAELTQRMQVVTSQISERVQHLMDMPVAASTMTAAGTTGKATRVARASTASKSAASKQAARASGSASSSISSVASTASAPAPP